ncbi:hypothetical protein CHLRE_09g399997v5 [Chlamydomonas reinhardtii]|uniref:Endonuclease/exonuclease/phosphatase domain-containing protein n=1 Tax=Chlamydomonas reinhardtii TaxID=3055 RepID=A0A2K3DEW3_CHLRE|nr:uncharacterized protein CHLRE_09g399997v5 [Chlamydomonas reinhardtii]PNW79080.1 hypothetical protein CHLRE_09g399997v5 [Chlamydomonas reinhardtii]
MVGGPVWGAFRGRTDLVLQAGGYPTTSDPSNLACAYVVSEQCAKSVGPKGEPQAPAGQGITNHIFACVRGPVWDPQLSHLHCAKFEMPGEEPMAARPRPAGAGPAGVQQQHSGAPAPRPPLDQQAAAGQDQEQTAVMQRYLAELADLNLQRQRRLQEQQQQQQQLQRQGQSPRPRTGSQVVVLATLGGQAGAGGGPGVAASRRGQRVDIVDHVGDVQMQEAAGVGDAGAAAAGASGPPAVASPSLPALVAGGSTRSAAATLRAERQQQPSSQQRVAAGGLSGGQPSAGVGGPPAVRRRTACAGSAGAQQQPSGAPAPQPPFDQRAAARQEQEQTAVMQRYLAYMADLHLQQQRRVQQQQQQEQQRQVQPPRPRTGSRFEVLATLGGQDGAGDGAAAAAPGRGRRVQPAAHAPPPPLQQQPRSKGRCGPAQLPQQRAGRLGGGLPPPQDGASSPPRVPTGRPAGGQQAGGGSGLGRQGGGVGRAVPQPLPQARPPLQTSQPAGGGKGRGRGLGAPAGASADTAGRAGGGAGSEAEYGAVCLTRDTCVAIGSDLVTHQNRCADVQGFEWAQLGHDTLGGRLLAYLRDQGATVPDWAVCRVPAGRTAILAQLHDEFTGWWRLYSAQPADTPLPSDVTEQLDDAAQQVQTAYMDYVLLNARTLRSAKRGLADPGGASGPSRRKRQHRSRSTSSLMSLGSAPLHPSGASSVNVNGLGSPFKARALVSHLQQVGADVAMVQETHATDTTVLESCLRAAQGACLPWRHCLAASPAASPHSCGTAILARSRLSLPGCVLQPPSTDAAGRVVCWDWDVGHLRLRFVCVYAPTAVADKPAFFAGLHPHLASDRVLVVGGDWNCVTDASQEGSTASPPLWVIQMQPLTSFLRRQVAQGALRTPLLPSGEQAPPAAHHADDTTLTARDPVVDGPVLMAAVQLFCRASNARVHPDKSKAMGLGRFAHLTGPCPHTGVPFTTGAVTHLGVPLSWDSDAAAADLYTRRARGMAFVARLWAALSLTLVGRVHIAKQVLAAKLAYHFSFLNPSPAQLKELTDLVDHFAARSMHAEDASLVSHGNPLLLPKRETACLPYKDGGVNHVDLPAFLSALQAKTFALLAQPGRQPWKMLTRALLTHVRPDSATTWAWVYSDAPAPAGLPARLAAAVGHMQSAGVKQHPPQPATQPPAAPPQWRVFFFFFEESSLQG